jgi:hypothetical protein
VQPSAKSSCAEVSSSDPRGRANRGTRTFPHRTRAGGPIVVPGRRAQRQSGPTFRLGYASMAFRSSVLRRAAQANSAAWTASGLPFAQAVLGRGQGVAAAAALIGQSLALSTQGAYQRLWVSFAALCRTTGRNALPASPTTMCAYLGTRFEWGSIRGQSLRPHVAAIGAQHCRVVPLDPTCHEPFKFARRGFAAADARRRSSVPLRSAAHPAAAA